MRESGSRHPGHAGSSEAACSGSTLARCQRRTKRGDERTPLGGDYDVLDLRRELRGARGRARARRLGRAGAGRRPLRDRRAPDLGLRGAHRVAATRWASATRSARRSATLVVHTPHAPRRIRLPWTFSTFDYRELCELLCEQMRRRVRDGEGRGARDRHGDRADTDRGDVTRAAGRRRARAGGASWPATATSRPTRRSRAGSRSTPAGGSDDLEIWIDRALRPGRLRLELPGRATRCGSGSARSTRASTSRSRPCGSPRTWSATAVRYQGNWIPHKLRRRDRGRGLLRRRLGRPLPAADRGGDPHRVLLRDRLRARAARGGRRARRAATTALRATARSPPRHEWKFKWMLRVQRLVPRVPPRLLAARAARDGASASSTGRSATTCGSRRPSSRGSHARGRPAAPSRSQPDKRSYVRPTTRKTG